MPFQTTEINRNLEKVEEKMEIASTQIGQFTQTVGEANAYWQKYKAADDDNVSLDKNTIQFSADAKAMTAEFMPGFAAAVAVIAGGSLSVDGDPASARLTVRDIAEQLVQAAIDQGLMAPE